MKDIKDRCDTHRPQPATAHIDKEAKSIGIIFINIVDNHIWPINTPILDQGDVQIDDPDDGSYYAGNGRNKSIF